MKPKHFLNSSAIAFCLFVYFFCCCFVWFIRKRERYYLSVRHMHPHVVVELLDLVKLCWADGADISGTLCTGHHAWWACTGTWGRARGRGPVTGTVQGHMSLQQGLVGELLFADVALVGLLPTMQAHVNVEGALLGEALVADTALVCSHSCVCHHVLDKVILQGEGTPTDAALVGLLTCVYKHVLDVVLFGCESLVAESALIRLFFALPTGCAVACR